MTELTDKMLEEYIKSEVDCFGRDFTRQLIQNLQAERAKPDAYTLEKRLALAEAQNRSYEITINKLKNPNSPIYTPSFWEKEAKRITDQRDALIEVVNDIIGDEKTTTLLLIRVAEIRAELKRIEAIK